MNVGPIIRVEIEGLKSSVLHYMQQHNDDFNAMVKEALEQTLTEDWVKESIQQAVNKTVQNAIDGLADNWQLKNAVSDALGKALAQMVDGV